MAATLAAYAPPSAAPPVVTLPDAPPKEKPRENNKIVFKVGGR